VNSEESSRPIDPQVRIGHDVHLKVSDLERLLRLCCGDLGFELTQRYGTLAASVSAGGYHHHIGLNTRGESWRIALAFGNHGLGSRHHPQSHPECAGRRFAQYHRCMVSLCGGSDHFGSEALYLRDPVNSGVEHCWDRPHDAWPRTPEGELARFIWRLDLDGLLKDVEAKTNAPKAEEGPRDW
jgi:catechol 2,3-dioxygenase